MCNCSVGLRTCCAACKKHRIGGKNPISEADLEWILRVTMKVLISYKLFRFYIIYRHIIENSSKSYKISLTASFSSRVAFSISSAAKIALTTATPSTPVPLRALCGPY